MSSTLEQDRTSNLYNTDRKMSYKDALLQEAADTSNRLGIHSFKLMHLLNKQKDKDTDDGSMVSEATTHKDNTTVMGSCRMRFQITLSETTQDSFMEDLSDHINKILEVININTPGVLLAPWHKRSFEQKELISVLSSEPLEAVKYLYGFKAGATKSGAQYFRIHIAYPSVYTADDIVRRNKNSIMIPGKQTLLKANSQCVNPTTIGWLLRSTPAMADCNDLEKSLKTIWQVKGGFGLYWATVKDGKPYNALTTPRAIHIEVEESESSYLLQQAEKTYGRASKTMEDSPLGMNMMFVQPYNEVQGSAKALVTKLATYQQTNEKMLVTSSWFGEMALEKSIASDRFVSLRQWLMTVTSIVKKKTSTGQEYNDKLFTSIHTSNDSQETKFYFYKVNEVEASNVVSALPLFIREELGLDPACFFHSSDFKHIIDGSWNKNKREYKNRNMLNQEQYLMELEDCFDVNREFFPQTIILEAKDVSKETEKHLAMANGEDEISMLSSLTEKTLKEATTTNKGTKEASNDDNSTGSGMTSKSKTQLAVRNALKEVSLEHNKAMAEQQHKFQQEIEKLRQALEQSQHTSPVEGNTLHSVRASQAPTATVGATGTEQAPEALVTMDVDDSSDDMASVPTTRRVTQGSSLSLAMKATASPLNKRPKRSKSRITKGPGDPKSSPRRSNV